MRRLKIFDYVILMAAVLLFGGAVFWSYSGASGVKTLEVEASGVLYLMPLDVDDELIVEGPVGKTVIHVRDGEAFVHESDCRDDICINMGHISNQSEWVACLPNRVFLRIVASTEEEADTGAY